MQDVAAGHGASSSVDLQLLANGGGGDSPAAPSRKGGWGSGEWGMSGVPLGVSRWAGLGAVEKLQVCLWFGGEEGFDGWRGRFRWPPRQGSVFYVYVVHIPARVLQRGC